MTQTATNAINTLNSIKIEDPKFYSIELARLKTSLNRKVKLLCVGIIVAVGAAIVGSSTIIAFGAVLIVCSMFSLHNINKSIKAKKETGENEFLSDQIKNYRAIIEKITNIAKPFRDSLPEKARGDVSLGMFILYDNQAFKTHLKTNEDLQKAHNVTKAALVIANRSLATLLS